jgi:hypothetical protein
MMIMLFLTLIAVDFHGVSIPHALAGASDRRGSGAKPQK